MMFGRNGDSPMPIVAPATPAECFDYRDRGVAHRAQVHDAGRAPLRRLPGQRRRAVEDPDRWPTCPTSRSSNATDRARRSSPTRATRERSPARGPCPARRASSTASAASKRPTSPATSATTPTTTTACRSCASRRSPASPTTSRRWRSTGRRTGDLLDPRLGLAPTARSAAPSSGCRPRAGASPTPTCATSIRCRRTPATCCAATSSVLVPEVNLGQLSLLLRARFLIDVVGFNKVRGKPFRISRDQAGAAEELLGEAGHGQVTD